MSNTEERLNNLETRLAQQEAVSDLRGQQVQGLERQLQEARAQMVEGLGVPARALRAAAQIADQEVETALRPGVFPEAEPPAEETP